jgi:hypothetical protein
MPDEFVEEVRKRLPPQPWPSGIHRTVALEMNAAEKQVSRAIKLLIRQAVFLHQVDGVVQQPQLDLEESEPQKPDIP